MALSQSLFPVGNWIANNAGVSVSLNNWGRNKNTVPVALDPTPGNRACALALRDQINSITPRLDRLLDDGLVPNMVRTARRLAFLNPRFSSPTGGDKDDDDTLSMAPVLAAMAQHLLTIAEWNTTTSSGPGATTVPSYPIRWQIYASGPREAWEWAAVGILAVVLSTVLLGGLYGLAGRVEPGPWLEMAGALLLANQSGTMRSAEGSVGGAAGENAKHASYYVRGMKGTNPALALVDEAGLQRKGYCKDVDKYTSYQSDGYVRIETWKIDWRPWRRVFETVSMAWARWTRNKP